MKRGKAISGLMVMLAVLAALLAQGALAADPAVQTTPLVSDVALRDGGVLLGQVVSPQGVGLSEARVVVYHQGEERGETKTDDAGYFAFQGLDRGGVYQLASAEGSGAFRVWSPGTAPPTAQPGALLVSGGQTVRGRLPTFMTNPWFVGGAIATAVAVPVAIHNCKDDDPVSP